MTSVTPTNVSFWHRARKRRLSSFSSRSIVTVSVWAVVLLGPFPFAPTSKAIAASVDHDDVERRRGLRSGSDADPGNHHPSYIRMCEGLVRRSRGGASGGGGETTTTVVTERRDICQDGGVGTGGVVSNKQLRTATPTPPLFHVFASEFLSEVARTHGLDRHLEYRHGCSDDEVNEYDYSGENNNDGTSKDDDIIQTLLPHTLIRRHAVVDAIDDDGPLPRALESLEGAVDLCRRCGSGYRRSGGVADPSCILMDPAVVQDRLLRSRNQANGVTKVTDTGTGTAVTSEPTALEWMAPAIRANLGHASREWSRIRHYDRGGVGGDGQGSSSISSLTVKDDGSADFRTVVYLPDESSQHLLTSGVFYALEIPYHTTSIEILSPESCGEFCVKKSRELRHLLEMLYPRAVVTVSSGQNGNHQNERISSAALYTKMASSDHLVCAHAVSCLLPAIAQGFHHSVSDRSYMDDKVDEDQLTFTVMGYDPERDPMLAALALGSSLTSSTLVPVDVSQSTRIGINGHCRTVRGRFGSWKRDLELSKKLQYRRPLTNHHAGMADANFIVRSPAQPFRPATTYAWESSYVPSCGLGHLLSRPGLCHALHKMGIHRIFFVGDSVTQSQAVSLWKMLGHVDGPSDDPELEQTLSKDDPNFSRTLQCAGPDVEIVYVRNDRLEETDEAVDFHARVRNCGTYMYCYPWVEKYLEGQLRNAGHTLLVAGVGSLYRGGSTGGTTPFQEFRRSFDEFVRVIDSFRRPDDLVLWRTVVPGHLECQTQEGPKPLEAYSQFVRTSRFSWDRFEYYNDHVHRTLHGRRRRLQQQLAVNNNNNNNTSTWAPIIEALDVYPMTVLRNDGHIGGEECTETCGLTDDTRDCLHYNLPGPVDWWNHLLFNNLLDIALETGKMSHPAVQQLLQEGDKWTM